MPTRSASIAQVMMVVALAALNLVVARSLPPEVTVLLIEHDMDLVFRFAQRIIVMAQGRVFAEGAPEVVRRDPRVREVYLGTDAAAAHD